MIQSSGWHQLAGHYRDSPPYCTFGAYLVCPHQRSLNAQLNTTEHRHRLARKLCFGCRGELRQPYQQGMEDQLGALGLVLNAVVLWNSTYLNAAVEQLRAQGYPVADADAARLSPLIDTHLNVHGTYTFFFPQLSGLRPLRDPAADPREHDQL